MSTNKRVLVLCGDGINCEFETAHAFRLAGFESEIRHLNDVVSEGLQLDQLQSRYSALALPGGFSFGDDLNSGKVLAIKIRHRLKWDLTRFAERGGLVIGICNGFQALVRLGVFGQEVSITANLSGKYQNQWVRMSPAGNKCVWLKGLGTISVPIRHGEGRVIVGGNGISGLRASQTGLMRKGEAWERIERLGLACLRYEGDPNGSERQTAGMCDPTGRILGMMPHPEIFVRWSSHPEWTLQPSRANAPGQGLVIFENAFREARHP